MIILYTDSGILPW